jgi:hypothetical protein
MALVLADRVQETSTTTGTGTITLAGAVTGFQSFAVVGNGNTCYYTIVDGGAWEVGIGTYSTTGPTLARTTILSNSNGNTTPITLAAGTKSVFLTYPAEKSVNYDASDNVGIGTTSPAAKLEISGATQATGSVVRLTNSAESSSWVAGNVIGQLDFYSSDSSDPATKSRITSIVESGGNFPTAVGLAFSTYNTSLSEKMRLDASGDLGLGITPSVWSQGRAIEIGYAGNAIWSPANNQLVMSQGAYWNSNWKYGVSSIGVAYYDQFQGAHRWYNAPSGTAGNAITFTQAMTLDASGNLGLGVASRVVSGYTSYGVNGSSGSLIDLYTNGTRVATFGVDTTVAFGSVTDIPVRFTQNNTEGMRLTSTGLGIGTTSPATKLDVATPSGTAALISTTITAAQRWQFGVEEVNGNYVIKNQTGGTTPVVISTTGNFGLGVTPSAWSSSARALQVGSYVALSNFPNYLDLTTNSFYDGAYKYINTATASKYSQTSGTHLWFTAPSGTAGNAITFTQAMTLDADGDLGIGTTSPAGRFDVVKSGDVYVNFNSSGGNGTSSVLSMVGPANTDGAALGYNVALRIGTVTGNNAAGFSEKARFDSSGNLGLGVTPSAWGSTQKAIEIGSWGAISSSGTDGKAEYLNNAIQTTNAGAFAYKNTAGASRYSQQLGAHAWFNAPSGTAGPTTAIVTGRVYTVTTLGSTTLGQWQAFFSALVALPTVNQSITATATGTLLGGATVTQSITFTQAMTLDASGNLQLGGTSVGDGRLNIGSITGASAGFHIGYGGNGDNYYTSGASGIHVFRTNTTERMRLDSSGNLGLECFPNSWGGGYKAFQISSSKHNIAATPAGAGNLALSFNAYYDSTDSRWEYVYTGDPATQYSTSAGAHRWYTAPTGTANAAITFTQAMTLDASGNLGVGTTSPYSKFTVSSGASNDTRILLQSNAGTGSTNAGFMLGFISTDTYAFNYANGNLIFGTNANERARITSGGELLVGTTSSGIGTGRVTSYNTGGATFAAIFANTVGSSASQSIVRSYHYESNSTTSATHYEFTNRSVGVVGTIACTGSATAYNTSSDYRLKNTIAPMTGALAKVALLKPCTYKWNADGSDGEGFIAHELAEVVPKAVTGEKDAVDADGNPKYQGIDTSFLVATLTAALQEAVAEINSLKARLDAANL